MNSIEKLDLKKKKFIIFDLDGTLIDSIGIWNLTDYALIKKFGNQDGNLDEIQDDRDYFLHHNTTGEIYVGYCNFLIGKYNLSIKDGKDLSRIRRELYEKIYESEISFKPNVVSLLKKLKDRGYTLILATMSSEEQIETYSNSPKMISEINIKEIFDLITTKDGVERKKPDPEIYQNILKRYKESSDKFLVFEDSYSGVLASINAGVETVNVYDKYSDKDRDRINEITSYAISDYQEIIDMLDKTSPKKLTYKSTNNK